MRISYNSIDNLQGVVNLDDRKSVKSDIKSQVSKNTRTDKAQSLSMENREKITLTGISNVESFNEFEIVLETVLGMLTIKGVSMHMSKLNLDSGDLIIDGSINSCVYSEKQDLKIKGAGFLSKLFK